jgi:lipoate-protein ligase A
MGKPAHSLLPAEAPRTFAMLDTIACGADDALYDERLFEHAAVQPTALIWRARESLVVPRSYRRFDAFEPTREVFSRRGWPVDVRQTGGGIVPQGPGIINLSLAWRVEGPPMQHAEAGYLLICDILARALNERDVVSFPSEVEGSFCDGRYNLAVTHQARPVKIAGTAQAWRRIPGSVHSHIGLIHALVMVEADTDALTALANEFEAAIGSDRRYRPECVVSLHELLPQKGPVAAPFEEALRRAIQASSVSGTQCVTTP